MITVLYEDNHLLAVNKPADLLTQPSGTERDSLEARAKDWIKKREHKPGAVYLHAVHRLDGPVSGIVLFARTSKALSRLNSAIRERATRKTYLALVSPPPPDTQEKVLEHYLLHEDQCAKIVSKDTPKAQLARLHYRVQSKTSTYAMLEVYPETGRYHQIRAQLAAHGSPIVNDKRYKGQTIAGGPKQGIGLHHQRLELEHPVTHERLVIQAPLPAGWPTQ